MRDDAVLGRALPLDRGLGVLECNIPLNTLQVILETTFPANRLIGVMRYKGRSINKLQNGIIVLIFKT